MTGELAIYIQNPYVSLNEGTYVGLSGPCLENYVHEPIQKKKKKKGYCVCQWGGGGVSDIYRFYHR